MNYLLAEIKQRKKADKILKIFQIEEEVYSLPTDLDNPKVYDSDYKLEDDEWFHIPSFKTSDYCIDILKVPFSSVEYNSINQSKLKTVKYLLAHQSYDEKSYFFFQKISSSHILNKSWFKISNTPVLDKSPILVINDIADAIYCVEDDVLYFKRLPTLTSIFPKIGDLYKEATQEETQDFLNSDYINLDGDYDANKVGAANRKRIAMAVETLNAFTPEEKTTIFDYIKEYCEEELPYDDNERHFTVNDEEGLKHLLWGIEQRYYTTKVGSEKRVANSVSTL